MLKALVLVAVLAIPATSLARDVHYPTHGSVVRELPHGYSVVGHGRSPYYYGGGSWYRPRGNRFVVIAPPIGLFVPVLPPFYSTLWYGGVPYYYADDSYYVWDGARRGYRVTEPPPEADAPATAPASDDLFIYPKNGQTEAQQGTDRYECHSWAASQTGFDPTQPSGHGNRDDYQRAMTACLEARGYSVK